MEYVELIKGIVEIVTIVIGLAGGGIGFYFWRENKDLKKAEVKEKESEVSDKQQQTWAHQNEEYQEYIKLLKADKEELKSEKHTAEEKEEKARKELEDMRTTLNDVVKRVGVLEVQVERAESFRCERLSCLQRIPKLKSIASSESTEENK